MSRKNPNTTSKLPSGVSLNIRPTGGIHQFVVHFHLCDHDRKRAFGTAANPTDTEIQHARETAIAFRACFNHCRNHILDFQPRWFGQWHRAVLYPYVPSACGAPMAHVPGVEPQADAPSASAPRKRGRPRKVVDQPVVTPVTPATSNIPSEGARITETIKPNRRKGGGLSIVCQVLYQQGGHQRTQSFRTGPTPSVAERDHVRQTAEAFVACLDHCAVARVPFSDQWFSHWRDEAFYPYLPTQHGAPIPRRVVSSDIYKGAAS